MGPAERPLYGGYEQAVPLHEQPWLRLVCRDCPHEDGPFAPEARFVAAQRAYDHWFETDRGSQFGHDVDLVPILDDEPTPAERATLRRRPRGVA